MDLDLEYGKILKESRLTQGLSLEDISYDLKINLSTLKNMEDSLTSELPKSPFTKNFIKTYCARLAIDPVPVIEIYEKSLGTSGVSGRIKKGVLSEDTEPKDFFILDFLKDRFFPIVILCSTVLAVGAIVSILKAYNFEKSSGSLAGVSEAIETNNFEELKMAGPSAADPLENKPVVEDKAEKIKVVQEAKPVQKVEEVVQANEEPEVKPIVKPVETVEENPEPPTKIGEHKLVVEPLAKSALYIKADTDKRPIRASLKPDTPRRFIFDKAEIRFLDAGAVNVIFDGEDIGALGIFGEEKTIEFPSLKEL